MSKMQCDVRSNLKGKASISSPKMIGFYSVGPDKNYLDNCSQLKYLNTIPQQVYFDLNHKIDSFERVISDEKLKFISSFFKDHRETFDIFDDTQTAIDDVPFMCSRALLKDFCTQPYKNKKYSNRFTVCLFRGTFFLHYLDPEQYLNIERKSSEFEKLSTKWGQKLEQYLLSSDPSSEPDVSLPMEDNGHFYSVFERHLEQHRLIFSAEMDGILIEHSLLREGIRSDTASSATVLEDVQDCAFIEIKSLQVRSEAWQHDVFKRYNSMNWWIQSHLAGVKTIFCGLRDDKGIVEEIEEHQVEDLPYIDGIPWKPQVCLNVCNNILTFIRNTFCQELKLTSWNRGKDVRMLPLKQLIFERKQGSNVLQLSKPQGSEDISILEDWFIDMFVNYENY